MSLPDDYTRLALWVAAHQRYVYTVSLGGPILLCLPPLTLLAIESRAGLGPWFWPWAGAVWFTALHWPLILAHQWFHPVRRPKTRFVSWSSAIFLTLYLLVATLGPLAVLVVPPMDPQMLP